LHRKIIKQTIDLKSLDIMRQIVKDEKKGKKKKEKRKNPS